MVYTIAPHIAVLTVVPKLEIDIVKVESEI